MQIWFVSPNLNPLPLKKQKARVMSPGFNVPAIVDCIQLFKLKFPSGSIKTMLLSKIISGGQTGVDRAALDVALEMGIPAGGYCPKGRKAEDGPIDPRYPLQELNSPHYPARTERNVLESDGTLIINEGPLEGGVALTLKMAKKYKKHFLIIHPSKSLAVSEVIKWLKSNPINVLNVAGPRESNSPGIYDKAFSLLLRLFHDLSGNIP